MACENERKGRGASALGDRGPSTLSPCVPIVRVPRQAPVALDADARFVSRKAKERREPAWVSPAPWSCMAEGGSGKACEKEERRKPFLVRVTAVRTK